MRISHIVGTFPLCLIINTIANSCVLHLRGDRLGRMFEIPVEFCSMILFHTRMLVPTICEILGSLVAQAPQDDIAPTLTFRNKKTPCRNKVFLVPPLGFEPRTPSLKGWRSNQLSYRGKKILFYYIEFLGIVKQKFL